MLVSWLRKNYLVLLIIAMLVAYPVMVSFMREQFAVYKIHEGAPATMLVVFLVAGYVVERYAKQKWGGMKGRGNVLLVTVWLALTLVIRYVFGIKLFW